MKAEINLQVTTVNLEENKNSKSFIFFGHFDMRVLNGGRAEWVLEKKPYIFLSIMVA